MLYRAPMPRLCRLPPGAVSSRRSLLPIGEGRGLDNGTSLTRPCALHKVLSRWMREQFEISPLQYAEIPSPSEGMAATAKRHILGLSICANKISQPWSLGTTIPIHQRKRFEKLLMSQNTIERMLVELPSFKTILRRINLPCRIGKETVYSTMEAKEEWTKVLKALVDGREMTTSDIDPASYFWVEKSNRVFPRLHLRGIQLRGGTLNTKARTSRGREKSPNELACCGACHARETLNHILQICEIMHHAR